MNDDTIKVPQMGRTTPAILASDSQGKIMEKLDEYLDDLRTTFNARHRQAKGTGEADKEGYMLSATISLAVAYDGPESAGELMHVGNFALTYLLNNLKYHDFFLRDVEEWQRVNFRLDLETPSPFGHSIGIAYTVHLSDCVGEKTYKERTAKEWIMGHEQFEEGTIETRVQGPSGAERVAEIMRLLAERGDGNTH